MVVSDGWKAVGTGVGFLGGSHKTSAMEKEAVMMSVERYNLLDGGLQSVSEEEVSRDGRGKRRW